MAYSRYANTEVDFAVLKGKTLASVENKKDELIFTTTEGEVYRQIYYEDCCASCGVEEVHGDLEDLVGSPILMAEEVCSQEPSPELIAERKAAYEKRKAEWNPAMGKFYFYGPSPESGWKEESETWTFFKAATIKGSVTIRWYGSSNGYYSEIPTFERVKKP